jgi:anti-anti-sigma factor
MNHTPVPIELGPELTIVHASQLRDTLLSHLGQGENELVLDLSGAAEVDSSGIQLLMSLQQSMQQQGRSLRICGMSKALRDVLSLYALQPLLDTQH